MKLSFPASVAVGVGVVVALGAALIVHAESKTNKVALASSPKPVTYVVAKAKAYRPSRTYIGTIRPWNEASVGPQFVAAYVDTVLVRPGAKVSRNDVLATLDCRNANAATKAIAGQAHAIDAMKKALADEAARKKSLLDRGFIAENDVVQAVAKSDAEGAQLDAQLASLAQSSLQVSDCILRAPFDGEVGARFLDPGAFARPSTPVVTIVDRTIVRVVVDVPEGDFAYVTPGTSTKIHVISTGQNLVAAISRRAPSADPGTRTIHVEIDVPDTERALPVNTTGEVSLDVGEPVAATEIPISAATIQDGKATYFTIDADVAHLHVAPLLGEIGAGFFLRPADLAAGAHIVTDGRESLSDKDRVTSKEAAVAEPTERPEK
jgi:membrane fusion protein, multidrug efflux system